MTTTWETPGAYATGTASAAPGYPAAAVGRMFIMCCAFGNGNNTPLDTPAGFQPFPNTTRFATQGGTYGTDTGYRGVQAFYRPSDGTESGTVTVNNNGSGTTTRVTQAQIMSLSKTEAAWFLSAETGVDETSGTGYSVTAGGILVPANGDYGIALSGWIPDSATPGTPTLTWDGVANTCTQVQSVASTQGADCRLSIYRRQMAGTGGSAPVFATTTGAAVTGATAFLLVHDGPAASAPSGWGIIAA